MFWGIYTGFQHQSLGPKAVAKQVKKNGKKFFFQIKENDHFI